MTFAALKAHCDSAGLTIDDRRITTGGPRSGFVTFAIGTGATLDRLIALREQLRTWSKGLVNLRMVTNPDHPDHTKGYVEVESFWVGPEEMPEMESLFANRRTPAPH